MNDTYLVEHHNNYKLNKISLEDIQKRINEYGIRNTTTLSIRPDIIPSSWDVNEITLGETAKQYREMSPEEQRFMKITMTLQMGMEGIDFAEEDFDKMMKSMEGII